MTDKPQNQSEEVELTQNNGNSEKKLDVIDENKESKKSSMKKSGKVADEVEFKKNYPLSYVYGAISAIALGASLYFSADLGTRHDGFYGPASFWPGCIITWLLFHGKDWLMNILGKVPDPHPGERWLCSKKRSMYYELFFEDDLDSGVVGEAQNEGGERLRDKSQSFNSVVPEGGAADDEFGASIAVDDGKGPKTYLGWSCQRFQGSCSRGIIELLINVALIYSFMFADKSGINPGIISSIFSSTCVFTIIMFYFWKHQKLSLNDWIGTFFIMLCVVFISIGGGGGGDDCPKPGDAAKDAEKETRRMLAGGGAKKCDPDAEPLSKEDADMYLYMSVIAALVAGFILSVNTVSLQYCVNVGCRIDQANFDGNFLMFTIFFPMYLITEITAPGTYSMRDLISGSLDIICITIGVIALGQGLKYGNGGPMQAIENQKTVIVTIITAIVYEKMPTPLQICGLVSGIVGVIIIVIQKQKKTEEELEEEKAEGEKAKEEGSPAKQDESGNVGESIEKSVEGNGIRGSVAGK